MGCGSSGSTSSPSSTAQLKVSTSVQESNQKKAKQNEKTGFLKEFDVVWIDKNIEDSHNVSCRPTLESMFNHAEYLKDNSTLEKKISDSSLPVIIISSGKGYDNIKEIITKKKTVYGIVIYCGNVELHKKQYQDSCKVLAVIDEFDQLPIELSHIDPKAARFVGFFDQRIQHTAYKLESNKEAIAKSLENVRKEKYFSVFYPFGARGIDLNNYLTGKVLKHIKIAIKSDDDLKKQRDILCYGIRSIKNKGLSDLESVIKVYSTNMFCTMLNFYMRSGHKTVFDTFKEFLLCFKGALCEACNPYIRKDKKYYRVFNLLPEYLKFYEENKGKCLLWSGFSSTMLKEEESRKYMKANDSNSTVTEITLVDPNEEFDKCLYDFGFNEENGIMFPVDINSATKQRGDSPEVLFPPFYPFKVKDVDKTSKHAKIIIEAPYAVNRAGRSWENDPYRTLLTSIPGKEKEWNKAFIKNIANLIKAKVMSNISIVKVNLLENVNEYDELINALKESKNIKQLIIEHENLDDANAIKILQNSFNDLNNICYLSLANNKLGDKAGKELAAIIKKSKSLTHIILENNQIGDTAGKILAEAIKGNKVLASVNLANNKISEGIVKKCDARIQFKISK